MVFETGLTHGIDFDHNKKIGFLEVNLMSRADRMRNVLDNVHSLHNIVVADCGTNSKLRIP